MSDSLTVACQVPLPMGFSKQEYWSGLLRLPPEDLHNPGIKLSSPVYPDGQACSLPLASPGKPPLSILFTKRRSCLTFKEEMLLWRYCCPLEISFPFFIAKYNPESPGSVYSRVLRKTKSPGLTPVLLIWLSDGQNSGIWFHKLSRWFL